MTGVTEKGGSLRSRKQRKNHRPHPMGGGEKKVHSYTIAWKRKVVPARWRRARPRKEERRNLTRERGHVSVYPLSLRRIGGGKRLNLHSAKKKRKKKIKSKRESNVRGRRSVKLCKRSRQTLH